MAELSFPLDWGKSKNIILLNTRMPEAELAVLRQTCEKVSSDYSIEKHLWLASSGTTGRPKLFAISEDSFLAAGRSVCDYFSLSSSDVLALNLPTFHVGGLGIIYRGLVSGAKVVRQDFAWDATRTLEHWSQNDVSFVSLVPTQLYDLLLLKLQPPRKLKNVLIGGGALSQELVELAQKYRWPITESFGMTESCGVIAVKGRDDFYHPLTHIQVRADANKKLGIQGSSLFSYQVSWDEHDKPVIRNLKAQEWYQTEDQVELREEKHDFRLLGRLGNDFVKIGGESVSLAKLNLRLQGVLVDLRLALGESTLEAKTSPRLGHEVELVTCMKEKTMIEKMINQYNESVVPFERIRSYRLVDDLQKTDLGKIKRGQ